jgi:DNA-binding IclR family transcriptional regulator
VHELVGTLLERRYLAPSGPGSNRFRLGVRGFQLGTAYAERLDLAREGRFVAEEISGQCRETVHIAILDGYDVVYVAKVDSSHPVRMVSAIGRRLPAHCTAVGKVLLAALSRTELREHCANVHLTAMTDNSITSRKALDRELGAIRDNNGVAREYCESNEAVACVAAPVRDRTGNVVAAMSISVPILRWNEQSEAEFRELVIKGAEILSERLGYIESRVDNR